MTETISTRNYITIKEYADSKKLSKQAVHQKIKRNHHLEELKKFQNIIIDSGDNKTYIDDFMVGILDKDIERILIFVFGSWNYYNEIIEGLRRANTAIIDDYKNLMTAHSKLLAENNELGSMLEATEEQFEEFYDSHHGQGALRKLIEEME